MCIQYMYKVCVAVANFTFIVVDISINVSKHNMSSVNSTVC